MMSSHSPSTWLANPAWHICNIRKNHRPGSFTAPQSPVLDMSFNNVQCLKGPL